MRKIIVLIILFISALFLLSCNKDSKIKADETEKARIENLENQIILTFSWWGEDTRHNAILDVIRKYQELNSNIVIRGIYGTVEGRQEYFRELVSIDDGADIHQIEWEWILEYKKEEKFLDLNEMAELINLEQFSEEKIEEFTVNGKLLAIPIISKELEGFLDNKIENAKVVYSISKTTAEPEECAKFLEFLSKVGIGETGMPKE